MVSAFCVKMEPFEGPLDLLLNLIRVNELDIFSVNLYVLVDQYLSFLRLVNFNDFQDSAHFVDIAASLCAIKVRYLLPRPARRASDEEELLSEDDLQESLRRRLQEYQSFKEASAFFAEGSSVGRVVGKHEADRLSEVYGSLEVGYSSGDKFTLVVLYEQLLGAVAERKPQTVKAELETLQIETAATKLYKALCKSSGLVFQKLFSRMASRYEFIAYFLAMLHLTSQRRIEIVQDQSKGPIWLKEPSKELVAATVET